MTDTDTGLERQLDEWLSGGTEQLYGPPENIDQTDRLISALAGVRRRRTEVMQLVADRLAALGVWRDQQLDQLDAREGDLLRLLEGWGRAEYERTGRKTWKLPAGEVKVRPKRARTELSHRTDAETVAALIEPMTGPGMLPVTAVKTTMKPQLDVLKANTSPGAVIPEYPAPIGYEARYAVGTFGPDRQLRPVERVIPGVVLLIPVDGPDGQTFTVVTP